MFGPISFDGVDNIRFYEKLCQSDPEFPFRPEARTFLERCASECTSAAFWINFQLFLLLVQRGELDTALLIKEDFINSPELPKTVARWVEIISSKALLDLGRDREALRSMVALYLQFRDFALFGELYQVFKAVKARDEELKHQTASATSDQELIATLRQLLDLQNIPLDPFQLCSSDKIARYHIADLPPITITLPEARQLNQSPEQFSSPSCQRQMRALEIYQIPNASISFDCVSVGIFDQDGHYIEPVSSGVGVGPAPEGTGLRLEGTAALLSDYFVTSNICHWIYDTLPRISYVQAGFSGSIDYWIVPSTKGKFVEESIKAFGIDPASLVSLEENPRISAENLIATSSSRYSEHPARQGWPENIEYLRSHLLPLSTEALHTDRASKRRILVSRADATGRRMIGEQELTKLLVDTFGFEVVSPGQLSFSDQIRIFSEADIVVGTHGAGLTNILFCDPGTLIIEIVPPFYFTDAYSVIARSLGLDYASVSCHDRTHPEGDETRVSHSMSRAATAGQQNFEIFDEQLQLIKECIDSYLGRVRPSKMWSVIDKAVQAAHTPSWVAPRPEGLRDRPELWLNRGFSYEHDALKGVTHIHGVRGFLAQGDVPFLFNVARAIPPGGCLLEVGSFLGLSATVFANGLLSSGNLNGRVICVDTWAGSAEHQEIDFVKDGSMFNLFLENVKRSGVRDLICPIRMPSLKAASLFAEASLDGIFIDADHSYEGCMSDLVAWWPKCKPGGFFLGHDAGPMWPVLQAVQDFATQHQLHLEIFDGPIHYIWVMSASNR